MKTNKAKQRRQILSNICQMCMCCIPFGIWELLFCPFPTPTLLFFCDLFFRTSGGTPWTDFGLPWGTRGPNLSSFGKISVATVLQISKTPAQQMSPTTPSRKEARMQTNFIDSQFK